MALFSDLIQNAMGGFGSNPQVPAWQNVTLPGSQQQATSANLSALPGLENLAGQTNQFNQQQITSMLNSVIPGWSNLTSTASSNIASMLKGEIPTDVSQAIQGSSAAQALTGGFGGSGLAGNLTAKSLGLTSLGLQQEGLSSAESWTGMMNSLYAPGQFNLASMFITPQQQFTDTMANQEQAWQVQWLKNQVAAMPEPGTAAIAGDLGQFGNFLGQQLFGNIPGITGSGGMGGGGGGSGFGNIFSSLGSGISSLFSGGGGAASIGGAGNAAGMGDFLSAGAIGLA